MDQWLVRTANNIIAGPYARDQVVKLIQEGKLSLQDEVCLANQYWIFLHEHVEVQRQLGIHMPRAPRGDDEEITETQTDAKLALQDQTPAAPIELATLPEAPPDYDGGTAVLSHGTIRDAKSSSPASPPARPAPGHPVPAPGSGSTMSHLAGAGPGTAAHTLSAQRSSGSNPNSLSHGSLGGHPAAAGTGNATNVQIERTSIWKSFAWLMVFVACLIVYGVLRMLRSAHG